MGENSGKWECMFSHKMAVTTARNWCRHSVDYRLTIYHVSFCFVCIWYIFIYILVIDISLFYGI